VRISRREEISGKKRNHGGRCTGSSVAKDPISDAGGPRFESHAGRVPGKPIPSLWRDRHSAIKGLRPPEDYAGKFRQDQKDSSESTKHVANTILDAKADALIK